MAGQTTRIAPQIHEVTPVRVPDQNVAQVRYAFNTARILGGKLASFGAVTFDVRELRRAAEGNYLLAADPTDLPKQKGWYRVDRDAESKTISFVSRNAQAAEDLRRAGRMFDVLYVQDSAVNAAIEGRPVALGVGHDDWGGRYLYAVGWSDGDARVALASPSQAGREAAAQNELASLMRVEVGKSQKVVFTSPGGERSEIKVPEGTTVHIE